MYNTSNPDDRVTNLYGVIFIDNVTQTPTSSYIQRFEKFKPNLITGLNGNSYGLKLNINFDTSVDNATIETIINDYSQFSMDLFIDTSVQLQEATRILLQSQNSLIDVNNRVNDLETMIFSQEDITELKNRMTSLETQVNNALALKLDLAGGTMSGVIAMGANKITGMADPTLNQDATTKIYVDTILGSATAAAISAAAAATSATNAGNSATAAASSATAAAGSATAAAASYDSFDDRYLGPKATDPTLDNDGNPLLTGALYFNTTTSEMRVYTGSVWLTAYLPASGYLALSGGTMTGAITFAAAQLVSITNGGTGQTTAQAAFDALAPSQTSNSGKYLTTNGTNASWVTVDALPSQTGNAGKYLSTNGTIASWQDTGASAAGVIWENSLVVSSNYTLTTSKNGFSVGPITINSGVVVTIPSGQRWVVL